MRTSTIEVARSRIRVIEDGSGDRAVLFVHGLGGWAENWSETIARVAASGRRAIAFDLPGFGESTPVPGARYFDAPAPLSPPMVEGVRRALGLARPHLVGHSLGGGIAGVTAVAHPRSWRSLTLVAPAGLGSDIPPFLRWLSLPVLGIVPRLPRPASLARAVLESCFHDRSRVPEHLYVECARYDRTYRETLRVMRSVATIRGVRRTVREPWLGRALEYRGPVLVVWGREDGILSAAQGDALGSAYPNAERRMIEDAGHLVMAERPDAFAAALLPFLDRAERDGGDARTMVSGVAHQER